MVRYGIFREYGYFCNLVLSRVIINTLLCNLINTKYGMKSDNFLYFRLTIHSVYIGDYKRRKKETRDIKRKVTYS